MKKFLFLFLLLSFPAQAQYAYPNDPVVPGSPPKVYNPAQPSTQQGNSADASLLPVTLGSMKAYILGLLQPNYTLQVSSAAGMRNLVGFPGVLVHRSGFSNAGDFGAAEYAFSTSPCTVDDGGTCLNTSNGSWQLDWSSVGFVATPQLFGATFNGSNSALDTAATQAAINTGRTVRIDLSGGKSFAPTNCLTQTVSGQHIDGVNRWNAWVVNPNTLPSSCKGVLISTATEPGPFIENLGIVFGQPDATTGLITYPPMFYLENVPRFILLRDGCYAATVCVDMKQNSGGAKISDFQMSPFQYGIDIDGSFDTVRLQDLHGFPFRLTANQQVAFKQNVFVHSAKMDDLKVSGGLFLGGTAFQFYGSSTYQQSPGVPGFTTGTISGVDFDGGYCALNISYGTITLSGGYMALGQNCGGNPVVANITGPANLTITGVNIQFNNAGVSTQTGAITVNNPAALVAITGNFINPQVVMPILNVIQGAAIVTGNTVTQGLFGPTTAGSTLYGPLFEANANGSSGGRMVINSNYVLDDPSNNNGGTLCYIPVDAFDSCANNVAPGWTVPIPPVAAGANPRIGIYGPNALNSTGHTASAP